MNQTQLIVFAKAPVAGRVKTRLTPPLTPEQAAAVHAASLQDVVARAASTTAGAQIMYDDSPDAAAWFGTTFPDLPRGPQAAGDLGDRMSDAFAQAFEAGASAVAIIGSDSPTLPAGLLEDALSVVPAHDVVLGPAVDGGYYFVALRREAWPAALPMFRQIAWSTGAVLRQTLDRISAAGLDAHMLAPWYDIDRPEDLALAALHAGPESALRQALEALPPALLTSLSAAVREPFAPPVRFEAAATE